MLAGVVTCPACGSPSPAAARFCMACGTALAPDDAPRAERKTLTCLFADLAGFTARADGADPEDVRAFLLPYYEVLTSEVTRHGGTVARHLGDGVLALFGAPAAHEDDPERAVRAALRIAERVPALELELHVRLGLNTGPVLFAPGGGEDAVTGDAVNTAARLQAAAPLDGIVVGEATYAATAHLFAWEELPPLEAKGKHEPLARWRPLAPLARLEPAGPETSPFVGHALELATLVRLFDRARSTPSLEVVTLMGEPGLGKSRLVRELGRHLDARSELVRWRVGRCRPYGEGAGFAALSDLVRAHAGIQDGDDQATIADRLEAVLQEPDPALRAWIRERVGPLAGLRVGAAPPQAEEAFTAWRRFLEGIARQGPAVLVVEDLHWAEAPFVAFLEHVCERTAGLPLLLLVTARPELEERHPAWLARSRRSTVLSLSALDEPDMRALLRADLPGADAGLLATVLARAGGSPLYAEQLAAMLRDRQGAALDPDAVPASVAALLAARLDALPAEAKSVLLDAAVVGRTFWAGSLAALSARAPHELEALLAELARRELVRPVFRATLAGEQEFAFVHALVRDVAYGALPRAARLARHRAAAAWISGRHAGEPLGPDAELVVGHLGRALALAETVHAPDLAAIRADLVTALLGAADHALRTQPAGAPADLRRALELLGPDDPRRPDVLGRLGRALNAVFEHRAAVPYLEEAAGLLEARGDRVAAAELAVPLSVAVGNAGDGQRAAALLAEARRTLEAHPGPGLVAVLAEQAVAVAVSDHNAEGVAVADAALAHAARLGLPAPYRALCARGRARLHAGDAQGETDLRGAIAQAEGEGDVRAAVVAFLNLATGTGYLAGPPGELRVADEEASFCEVRGIPRVVSQVDRCLALFYAGDWDRALAEADVTQAWGSERGYIDALWVGAQAAALVHLERGEPVAPLGGLYTAVVRARARATSVAPAVAEAALARGDREEAVRILGDAIERTAAGEMDDLVGVVRACLRAGAPDLASRALDRGAPRNPLDCARTIAACAGLAEAEGDVETAHAGFADAVERFTQLGVVPEHAYALAGLGRCLIALGEIDEGVARLREARVIWEGLRATPRIAEVDAALAATENAAFGR